MSRYAYEIRDAHTAHTMRPICGFLPVLSAPANVYGPLMARCVSAVCSFPLLRHKRCMRGSGYSKPSIDNLINNHDVEI